MGYYVNPADGSTKEQWLAAQGKQISEPEAKAWKGFDGDTRLVCRVDNISMGFTAAGIAYDPRERDVFLSSETDTRPRTWWEVPKEKLAQFIPEHVRKQVGF